MKMKPSLLCTRGMEYPCSWVSRRALWATANGVMLLKRWASISAASVYGKL